MNSVLFKRFISSLLLACFTVTSVNAAPSPSAQLQTEMKALRYNSEDPNMRIAKVPKFIRFVNGQGVQLGVGTAAFMVGQVIECFGRAQVSGDDMIFRACVDSLSDAVAWTDMAVFGLFSQVTSMTIQNLISKRNWTSLNAFLLEHKVAVLDNAMKSRVIKATASGTSKVFSNHVFVNGIGMTVGSFATHYFSKFHTSEQYKASQKSDREYGFWLNYLEQTELRLAIVRSEIKTLKISKNTQDLIDEKNKQKEILADQALFLKEQLAKIKSLGKELDPAVEKALTNRIQKFEDLSKNQSVTDMLRLEQIELEEGLKAGREKVRKYKDQYWQNMSDAIDFAMKNDAKEWQQLGTDAARMVTTSTFLAGGWWMLKDSPHLVKAFRQNLGEFAKSVTDSEKQLLIAHYNVADIEKVPGSKQPFAVALIMKQRANIQVANIADKFLPKIMHFTKTPAEMQHVGGSRELVAAFDKKSGIFKLVGSVDFEKTIGTISSSRRAYLTLYKWGFRVFGGQVVNAVAWLSLDRQIANRFSEFKYSTTLNFTKDWDETTKIMSLADRVEAAKAKLIKTAVAVSKKEAVTLKEGIPTQAETQVLLNEKKKALQQAAEQEKIDISEWTDDMVALPDGVTQLQADIEAYHNVFRTYREERFLKNFNEHFQGYLKKHTDNNTKDYTQGKLLRWLGRGATNGSDVSLLGNGLTWLGYHPKESAKVSEMFADKDFQFNGSEDPVKIQENQIDLTENAKSDLYGTIGKPWHADLKEAPGDFDDEIKKLFSQLRKDGMDVAKQTYTLYDFSISNMYEASNKYGFVPSDENYKCKIIGVKRGKQGLKCLISGPAVFSAYRIQMTSETEDSEKDYQKTFSKALKEDIAAILPPERYNVESDVALTPYEDSYENEFYHLRDVFIKIGAQVPSKNLVMVDLINAYMNATNEKEKNKTTQSAFLNDKFNETLGDLEREYAPKATSSLISGNYEKSQEDRNEIIAMQFFIASQNIYEAFLKIRSQAQYLLNLNFDRIEKCGGFNSENVLNNKSIKSKNPLDQANSKTAQQQKLCSEMQ